MKIDIEWQTETTGNVTYSPPLPKQKTHAEFLHLSNHEIFLLRQFIESEIKPFKEENAKLTRLLAEACKMLDDYSPCRGSDELEQWWDERKKEHQNEG